MKLSSKIEGYLFIKGEAVSMKELQSFFHASSEEVTQAVLELQAEYVNRGMDIASNDEEVEMVTSSEFSALANEIRKEELSKELTKSALEVLSIVLYKGEVTRAEIDYVRGVNSSYILRNMEIRGLVAKKIKDGYERIYAYYPTIDLLRYMGVSKRDDLPDFETIERNLSMKLEEFYLLSKVEKDSTLENNNLEDIGTSKEVENSNEVV